MAVGIAALAIASVPAAMALAGNPGFLLTDNFAERLTPLSDTTESANLATWIVREGATARLFATLAPLAVLGLAGYHLWRRRRDVPARTALIVTIVPALGALALACAQLAWWAQLDVLVLALLAAVLATQDGKTPPLQPWPFWSVTGLLLLPGLLANAPLREAGPDAPPTRQELESLVERDLAYWLARRAGPDGAIVLAPPNLTTSLYYHGGLRGLGSSYRENADGFRASIRIAGAVSVDEAQALARQRRLTHIIVPSWDGFLDEYARLGSGDAENSLMGLLHSWLPPRWLRPVPYHLPAIEGFADDRVVIFEMTDLQDNATSLSRLTEYFLDMGQVELASMASRALGQAFGADLGAQVAKARTEFMRRDRGAFTQSLESIAASLGQDAEETLPWDRRVSLCLVLAEGERIAAARGQAQRCLDEMGEYDLRGLSPRTLFRFLTLCRALGLELRDPQLQALAMELLPPEVRPAVR